MSIAMWFSDPHCPAMHKDYPDFLNDVKKKYKPDIVLCGGDELDFHTLSIHPKETVADGTLTEFEKGLKQLKILYKIFPKVKSCVSNHTIRPYRMAATVGVPEKFMIKINQLLEAPKGWTWDDFHIVDNVKYMHGDEMVSANMLVSLLKQRKNIVYGHYHSLSGLIFNASDTDRLFAMSTGCGADRKHYMMRYGKKSSAKPVLGCGIIIDGKQPIVIPMEL